MVSVRTLNIVGRGALLGVSAGLILSIAYTIVAIPAVGLLLVLTNIPSGKVFEAFIGAGAFAICAWPFSILLGVLPAIIIGALGGSIVALVLAPLQGYISKRGAALVGLAVATVIVVSAHLVLGPGLVDANQPGLAPFFPYLFWLVGPSVLVLCGLTWVGWKLFK